MPRHAAQVLTDLNKPWHVQVYSTQALVASVEEAVAKDDEQRRLDDREIPRRKEGLRAIPSAHTGLSFTVTPWEVLHALGRALVLGRQGAGRGLAEHWGGLKYCQALEGKSGEYMALSAEGLNPRRHYKTVQSSELGKGFALVLAERIVRKQYPDHAVAVIDADIALQAGWALVGRDVQRRDWVRQRPDFLLEAWKPGEPSKIIPLACRGTHAKTPYVQTQLASASAQVEAFHIGPWGDTPSLVISSELLGQGGVVVHALHTPGAAALHVEPGDPAADADKDLRDENIYPEVQFPPDEGEDKPRRGGGFQVLPEHYAWFKRATARAGAAGLMAFTGGGNPTAQYLTKRQGRQYFEGFVHEGTGIVQDAEQVISGTRFLGTDHVFRLNGTRVEAFSGVAEGLFELLAEGKVEQY